MRVLHVLPMFSASLANGSEYYSYQLSRELSRLGVSVDVYTTRSAQIRPASLFTLQWLNDFEAGQEQSDNIHITRFCSLSLPQPMGHLVSASIWRQWHLEERRYGVMVKGSDCLEAYYVRRARSRPAFYEWFFMLGLGPWSFSLLRQLIRDLPRYDLVLTGYMPFALPWQVMRLAQRQKKPVVILPLFHPDDVYHHHRLFYECFSSAAAILALTPYSEDLFKRLAPSARPVQVGAGVDVEMFTRPTISGNRFRVRFGLGTGPLVLCVGRKEAGKRYDWAIRAVDQLQDASVKLVMIGEDVDKVPIASRRTVFLGKVSREDLIDAYDACDVFLAPSEHESFGMVFLEAWMRRKPVIGNARCRPVASVIENGEDGFSCWNAREMAVRIAHLLDHPEFARQMGEQGYRKTLARYTWTEVGKKVYDLYQALVTEPSSRTGG